MKNNTRKRITSACTNCKNKKTKCEVERPCRNCLSRNWECVSIAPGKRGPRKDQYRKKNSHKSAKPAKPVKIRTAKKTKAAKTTKTNEIAEVVPDGTVSPSSLHSHSTSPSSSTFFSYYQDNRSHSNLGHSHSTYFHEEISLFSTESDNVEQGVGTPENEDDDFSNFINYDD